MASENPTAISRVSRDAVQRAVMALLKWKNSQSKTQKLQLLEQDEFLYLVLTLKKIPPKGRTNAHKVALPHRLHEDASELCLIIDDRPKSSKLTSDAAKKKIKAEDIPITKVLKVSKLKTDYRPFEAKRKLCNSYDMFFADKRVIPLLPKLLGKQFFKKKKIPLPVDLTHNNWKEQIERACTSALLYMGTGTCCVVRVGKASMESEELVENVVAAIDGVVEIVPKKWAGVRSFHLKFSESVALPIYQALPDMKLKIEGAKKCDEEVKLKEEKRKEEKLDGEKDGLKKKKKGRIHEVRYMDDEVSAFEDALEKEGNDKDDTEADERENDVVGNPEILGSKRKKEGSMGVQAPSNLNGEKGSKKALKAQKGEDSGEKRIKKSGVGKLKDGANKVKDKKIKKKKPAL
ncbi:hypothetical protein NMG60_11025892 [Bertholletia excelsa]